MTSWSPYTKFTRAEWARLRAGAALTLTPEDVLRLKGLNEPVAMDEVVAVYLPQVAADRPGDARVFVSDFFDFSIYVDAPEVDIRRWYVERFLLLRATAFKEPDSYFHRYASLSDEAAERTAETIWDTINGPNLRENILPTRERAHLVLVKGRDHRVDEVWLRKL